MCMGGGGGGGFGGGGGGFGGGGLNFGNFGTGLNFGGGMGDGGMTDMGGGITKPVDPNVKEGEKAFLGSKPGFDEKKLQALANRSGKQSLYIS
tara:strand:- start:7 stop:285 length:279 start_codon:yes stop_codon:yes gene_type:complete